LVSDVEAGVAPAGSLWRFWWMHGYLDEGRAHLAKLLASSPPSASRARAKALNAAGLLALWQGDFGPARSDLLGSLALAEQIDDGSSAAFALMFVGRVYRDEGDVEASRVRGARAVALFRELGSDWDLAFALHFFGLASPGPTVKRLRRLSWRVGHGSAPRETGGRLPCRCGVWDSLPMPGLMTRQRGIL
jgi:hypothetical protein